MANNDTVTTLEAVIQSSVDPNLKYIEVGSMVAMVLFGISTAQVYIYLRARGEILVMRVFVTIMWLLELVHTFLTGWTIYKTTINQAAMEDMWQTNMTAGLIAALISACAQIFFSYRLWVLLGSNFLPVFCSLVASFRVVGFYTVVINEVITGIRGQSYEKLLLAVGILSWGDDILIASGLAWCIWTRNKERVYERGNVDKILMWFFETNVATCLATSVTFIAAQANDHFIINFIWVPFAIITCRLYSMCIFASLVAKIRLAEAPEVRIVDIEFMADGLHNLTLPTESTVDISRRFS